MTERSLGGMEIAGRQIGPGHPCYIIAEAGSNHNGSFELALALVDAAADARCDAVKFQLFRAEDLVVPASPHAEYLDRSLGERTIFEHFKHAELDRSWVPAIAERCRARGIAFVATPFDLDAIDLLVSHEVSSPVLKMASCELWHDPLLRHAARTRLPLLLSTGMATIEDVADAVGAVREEQGGPICILQCTVRYPAPAESVNLRAMATMSDRFGVPVGLSDHTEGRWAAVASVALGASVIEKHFTLARTLPGPDHVFAIEPNELSAMVREIRATEAALGDGVKVRHPVEEEIYLLSRRNLVARRDLQPGDIVTDDDLVVLRSPLGIEPKRQREVVGRPVVEKVRAGTPMQWSHLGTRSP